MEALFFRNKAPHPMLSLYWFRGAPKSATRKLSSTYHNNTFICCVFPILMTFQTEAPDPMPSGGNQQSIGGLVRHDLHKDRKRYSRIWRHFSDCRGLA
jgi:hypothetical protein